MKRIIALVAIAATLLGLSAATGSAPAGAATIQCKTSRMHWAVTEGSVSIRIAWIEMYVEACTDGVHLNSTAAWTDSDMTGPGISAGFVFAFGRPHRTSFNDRGRSGGAASYTANGTDKDCASHWVHVFCSPTENFEVQAHLTMANALYVRPPGPSWWTIHGRYFRFVYTARCTNRACALHFHH
jgi:hypothetical protein